MPRPDLLWRTACDLNRRAALSKPLPALFFVTDPLRVPDPAAVAERLPEGCGVIFRGFGRPDALAKARALAGIAERRGLILLVGLDPLLAEQAGAHGVHLPESEMRQAPDIRARHPGWLITTAAHDAAALTRAAGHGLDAALVSPVFESRSPSAHAPLGVERFTRLVRSARLPVYALGGVTNQTAPLLQNSGAAGLAAVEGLAQVDGVPAPAG